jgi:hypothetical protein
MNRKATIDEQSQHKQWIRMVLPHNIHPTNRDTVDRPEPFVVRQVMSLIVDAVSKAVTPPLTRLHTTGTHQRGPRRQK